MGLLSVEEALERVLELCVPLAEETVSIEDAVGRALSTDLVARQTLPPWDNSAMDGYALRTVDLQKGPLEVVEKIFAGQVPAFALEEGMCARIMTGAQVPVGADAVVMQERVRTIGATQIEVLEVPKPGANIRRRGEDVLEGRLLLLAGTPIGLGEAGALWGQGLTRVSVRRRPTVSIASSGDELCNAWEASHGRIVDTNSPVLARAVVRAGGVPNTLGVAPDRLDAITAHFSRGLSSDVLITIAGASVGERDFTRDALSELGVAIDFWKVAMKPGKPLAVGRKDNTLVFGLPGNPVSAMVTFELFVRPALRALQGLPPARPMLPARISTTYKKAPGLRHFLRATVETRNGGLMATPLANQSSGAYASVIGATHLISVEPDLEEVPEGSEVRVLQTDWAS